MQKASRLLGLLISECLLGEGDCGSNPWTYEVSVQLGQNSPLPLPASPG